jgi:hypothetical protein
MGEGGGQPLCASGMHGWWRGWLPPRRPHQFTAKGDTQTSPILWQWGSNKDSIGQKQPVCDEVRQPSACNQSGA